MKRLLITVAVLITSVVAAQSKDLNATSGKIEKAGTRLQVRVPEMRATLNAKTFQGITVHFTFVGPTSQVFLLDSGEARQQFGVKLRAKDVCNLIYVMWHFNGQYTGINVSVKSNPGKTTSQQCHDNGYINNIPAKVNVAVPLVKVDEPHTLATELNGLELTVVADGVKVWQGTLPVAASTFDGPLGFPVSKALQGQTV